DACLGHPNQTGTYHNHVIPKCLFASNASVHSPIIGYAFDGFPIYGPYAYTNTNGTGAIKRMTPSYQVTTATTRTNGPAMNTAVTIAGHPSTYYAGTFLEDYIYTPGLGDLDQYNGRFCITPEYPAGIYAYFVTVDSTGGPIYPYVLGPQYYGTVNPGNTGPSGGSNAVPGTATLYVPSAAGIVEYNSFPYEISIYPNPVQDNTLQFQISDNSEDLTVQVMDYQGRVLISKQYKSLRYANTESLPLPFLTAGMYMVTFESGGHKMAKRIVVTEE
ncbi:MAG TPA: YHYH protein, partial [Bacteroidia bacterium]|nr:YHYH protein [Bacteroidia bacterium]